MKWLLLNQKGKLFPELLLVMQKQDKFHRHSLRRTHRRIRQFQNFSLRLHITLKDLCSYHSLVLQKTSHGNKDILRYDFIKALLLEITSMVPWSNQQSTLGTRVKNNEKVQPFQEVKGIIIILIETIPMNTFSLDHVNK